MSAIFLEYLFKNFSELLKTLTYALMDNFCPCFIDRYRSLRYRCDLASACVSFSCARVCVLEISVFAQNIKFFEYFSADYLSAKEFPY